MKLYEFVNRGSSVTFREMQRALGTSNVPFYWDYTRDYELEEKRREEFFEAEREKAVELIRSAVGLKNPVVIVHRTFSNYFGWENVELELLEETPEVYEKRREPHEGSATYVFPFSETAVMQEYEGQEPYIQEEYNNIKVPDIGEIRKNMGKYTHTYNAKLAEELL